MSRRANDDKDRALLLEERRQLLAYALEVRYQSLQGIWYCVCVCGVQCCVCCVCLSLNYRTQRATLSTQQPSRTTRKKQQHKNKTPA
jgi:hypothetical protein